MKTLISFGWGGLLVLLGTALLGWIGYNVLVEAQPETEGRSPIKPAIGAVVMIGVGVNRIRSTRQGARPAPRDDERMAA